MWRYTYNLRGLMKRRPWWEGPEPAIDVRKNVTEFVQQARASGRTLLNEFEAKQVLASYGIPVVETRAAENEDQAVATASADRLSRRVETSVEHHRAQD